MKKIIVAKMKKLVINSNNNKKNKIKTKKYKII